MVIIMEVNANDLQIKNVIEQIHLKGLKPHISTGEERTIIGVIGDDRKLQEANFKTLPGVENVFRILKPYKLVSREFKRDSTIIHINGVSIGNGHRVVIAGPCAVESGEQILKSAQIVKSYGANILRGGAFKPRTNPYTFQGLGIDGLKLLQKAKQETGLPIVTEVLEASDVELVSEYADILQIGTRNMQNCSASEGNGIS